MQVQSAKAADEAFNRFSFIENRIISYTQNYNTHSDFFNIYIYIDLPASAFMYLTAILLQTEKKDRITESVLKINDLPQLIITPRC